MNLRSTRRSAVAMVLLAIALGSNAGCGGGSADSGRIQSTGSDARDKAIAARLAEYIDRNTPNGQRPLPPAGDASPLERRAYAELSDNLARLEQSIERISVKERVITVYTSLAAGKEGSQTARLICTYIYGADVADTTRGHAVVGSDGRVLARCAPNTNPLK